MRKARICFESDAKTCLVRLVLLLLVVSVGWPLVAENSPGGKEPSPVMEFCRVCYYSKSVVNPQALKSRLEWFLQQGANPNAGCGETWEEKDGVWLAGPITALDYVEKAPRLSEELRGELTALLRKYGAKTYPEMHETWSGPSGVTVFQWIAEHFGQTSQREKWDVWEDSLFWLLERGGESINQPGEGRRWSGLKEEWIRSVTVLDEVRDDSRLPEDRKVRLIRLLREHGAKSYLELLRKNPQLGGVTNHSLAEYCLFKMDSSWGSYGRRNKLDKPDFDEELELLLRLKKGLNDEFKIELFLPQTDLIEDRNWSDYFPMTALDMVLMFDGFSAERRTRLVSMMREYGCKTYVELGNERSGRNGYILSLCKTVYEKKWKSLPPEFKEIFLRYLEFGLPMEWEFEEVRLWDGVSHNSFLGDLRNKKFRVSVLGLIGLSELEPTEKAELRELLLKHGALTYAEMVRKHPEILEKAGECKATILDFCQKCYMKAEEVDGAWFVGRLKCLLSEGYDPNTGWGRTWKWDDEEHEWSCGKVTALDYVSQLEAFSVEERKELVDLMRQYGAKSYPEVAEENGEEASGEEGAAMNVLGWCRARLERGPGLSCTKWFDRSLYWLVERESASVNQYGKCKVDPGYHYVERNATALDLIQYTRKIDSARKTKIAEHMRACGAKTYLELMREDPAKQGKASMDGHGDDTVLDFAQGVYIGVHENYSRLRDCLEYVLLCDRNPNRHCYWKLPCDKELPEQYRYPGVCPMTALNLLRASERLAADCRQKLVQYLQEHGGKCYAELESQYTDRERPMNHLCRVIFEEEIETLPPVVKKHFQRYLTIGVSVNQGYTTTDIARGLLEFPDGAVVGRLCSFRLSALEMIHFSRLKREEKELLEKELRKCGATSYLQMAKEHPELLEPGRKYDIGMLDLCRCVHDSIRVKDLARLAERVEWLLEQGYDPNDRYDEEFQLRDGTGICVRRSALDYLECAPNLTEAERKVLVDVLRKHGAKNYGELSQERPDWPAPNDLSRMDLFPWVKMNYGGSVSADKSAGQLEQELDWLLENASETINASGTGVVRITGDFQILRSMTALDVVLNNKALEPEQKKAVVRKLRSHGAKTYLELLEENPELGGELQDNVLSFCRKAFYDCTLDTAEVEENLEYLLRVGKKTNVPVALKIPYENSTPELYQYPGEYPLSAVDIIRVNLQLPQQRKEELIQLLVKYGEQGFREDAKRRFEQASPVMDLCWKIFCSRETSISPELEELLDRYLECGFPLNYDCHCMDYTLGLMNFEEGHHFNQSIYFEACPLDLIHWSRLDPSAKARWEKKLRDHGARSFWELDVWKDGRREFRKTRMINPLPPCFRPATLCDFCLSCFESKEITDCEVFLDRLEWLLKNGYDPNCTWELAQKVNSETSVLFCSRRMTALDCLVYADCLPLEIRKRAWKLMRQYGAKTYSEWARSSRKMECLNTAGLEVDPHFQKVLECFDGMEYGKAFKVSTEYEGWDKPVLVVSSQRTICIATLPGAGFERVIGQFEEKVVFPSCEVYLLQDDRWMNPGTKRELAWIAWAFGRLREIESN